MEEGRGAETEGKGEEGPTKRGEETKDVESKVERRGEGGRPIDVNGIRKIKRGTQRKQRRGKKKRRREEGRREGLCGGRR